MRNIFAILAAAIGGISIADALIIDPSSTPLPPSKDPWYTMPADAECSSPGSSGKVLRIRHAPAQTQASITAIKTAWNILFCTMDSLQLPTFAVTTVLFPRGADGRSLLSYHIAYDSADIDQSPSYQMNNIEHSSLDQAITLPSLIDQGWVINIPDYEGPNASLGSGLTSAYAAIDSIRAILALQDELGINEHVRYAMYGYSGASVPTEWAAEVQASYAPDLNFSGIAFGGVVTNLSISIHSRNGGPQAGIAVQSLLGLASKYPDINETLRAQLNIYGEHNATGFLAGYQYSISEAVTAYRNQSISAYFKTGLDWLKEPRIQHILNNDGIMTYHGIPQMPLFIHHSAEDQNLAIARTDSLVERFCGVGVQIKYIRNSVGGHIAESLVGTALTIEWLRGILSGSWYRQYGCVRNDIAKPITKEYINSLMKAMEKQGLDAIRTFTYQQLDNLL